MIAIIPANRQKPSISIPTSLWPRRADFEASVRFGNRIYWIGSHGNDKDGNTEPTRNMVCSYDVAGTGTATTLTYVNKFTSLKSNLISWDSSNGHGLGSNALGLSASAASGVLPTDPNGFNIEAATNFGSNVLLGFRAPLQNKNTRSKALVIPVTNFQARVDAGSGTMTFGAPIFLDLGGRAIRSMATMPSGKILILAGPTGDPSAAITPAFQLYSWNGSAASAPVAVTSTLNTIASNGGGSPEAIVDPPAELAFGSQLQVIQDNGTTVFYGDGIDGKSLATRAFAKSRSDTISITDVPDETPPVLTLPANLTREATDHVSTPVTFAFSANDAVNGPVTATATPPSGSGFPLGQTTVTVTASDTAGNTVTSSFTVTIVDTTAPTLTVPENIIREATTPTGATVNFSVSATDIVDLSASLIISKSSGSVFPLGITTVSVSATDDAGNSSSGSFTVNVIDTTAPSLTVPANVTAEATTAFGTVVNFSATATDLVDGAVIPTSTPASGSVFPPGTTTVHVSAADSAGNSAAASFTVTIVDTTAPTLILPADIAVRATNSAGATVTFATSATDLVAGLLAPTATPPSGSIFPIGSTPVLVTVVDGSGNIATASFNIVVTSFPPAFVSTPIIVPPSGNAGVTFSANVSGTPGSTIFLEASTDLGSSDPWEVIGQLTLDGTGQGTFTNVTDPDTVGISSPTDYFRLRAD